MIGIRKLIWKGESNNAQKCLFKRVSCSHEQFLVSEFTHILLFYDNVPDPFTNALVIINIRQKKNGNDMQFVQISQYTYDL